jgi:acid phosphatase type 7
MVKSAFALTALILAAACVSSAVTTAPPEQIHLSLAGSHPINGSPTGMRVAWYTSVLPNSSYPPLVQYGLEADHLSSSAVATSSQYLTDHGYHHVALMNCTNLVGGDVYYRVGSGTENITWSSIFTFSTAKWAPDAATQISIFGDLGYEDSSSRRKKIMEVEPEQFSLHNDDRRFLPVTKDWSATFTRIALEELKNRNAIDMIFHAGDIGYADDSFLLDPLHFTYEEVYNGYLNWFQNITTIMPYMVTPGNHESECHSPACVINHKKYGVPLSNFTAFNQRWHMPSEESGGHKGSNMWYSFNLGTVHYVSIDSETDFDGAEEETTGDSHMKNLPAGGFGYKGEYMKWLENDLAEANRLREEMVASNHTFRSNETKARPWIVAVGHRPYGDIVEAAKLFEKYHVDVYFAGHLHSYARTDGGSFGNGTMYVVAGGAGCDEMKQGKEEFFGSIAPPTQSLTITSHRYSSGVMTVNQTHLKWELIDSVTGQILDSFQLEQ